MLRSVKWESPSSRSVKACPRCGSLEIQLSSKFDAWLTPKLYVCRGCGYIGPIVLEIDKDTKEKGKNQES